MSEHEKLDYKTDLTKYHRIWQGILAYETVMLTRTSSYSREPVAWNCPHELRTWNSFTWAYNLKLSTWALLEILSRELIIEVVHMSLELEIHLRELTTWRCPCEFRATSSFTWACYLEVVHMCLEREPILMTFNLICPHESMTWSSSTRACKWKFLHMSSWLESQ
jgi:hypothetical protein